MTTTPPPAGISDYQEFLAQLELCRRYTAEVRALRARHSRYIESLAYKAKAAAEKCGKLALTDETIARLWSEAMAQGVMLND